MSNINKQNLFHQQTENRTKSYSAYPTAQAFHKDYKKFRYRFLAGPPASGKSVACAMELLAIALRQEPTPTGVRPSRFGIVRSTYGELERTTLETLKTWLPANFTRITYSKPIKVRTIMPLSDGTVLDAQFNLIAIESDRDLGKLDSYEATAIWLNEMTGLPAEVVGKAGERVGRYPPSVMWDDQQNHCTYYGVIGDHNYPSHDHWLVSYLHQGEMPPRTQLYKQPPALLEQIDANTGEITYRINPQAENLVNLSGGIKYIEDLETYQRLGLDDMIQTRLLCRYGKASGGGKSIFTNFNKDRHIAAEPIKPMVSTNTLVSIDTSGIHPCALFWQYVRGKWAITDGIYGDEMGFEEFVDDVLLILLKQRYGGCHILCVCDPANARDARTAITPIDLLRDRGLDAISASTNKFKDRLQACEMLLSREKGGVLISPTVSYLIGALEGGYQYRRLRVTGAGAQYSTQPLKNDYSHWADAFQYGALYIIGETMSERDVELIRSITRASLARGRGKTHSAGTHRWR